MEFIKFLTASLPVLLPLIFLVIIGMPAKKAMPISSAIFIIITFIVWGVSSEVIFASIIQGFHQALTIILILFGSLTLLNTLKNTGAVTRINQMFKSISEDMRVQAVMLAWLFGSLIEGAAGFGTPAAVVGPLMVLLGFNPISAASLALIGDSIAVSFGAISTPITQGLDGVVNVDQFNIIGQNIAMMDLIVGSTMPLIIIFIFTQVLSPKKTRNFSDFTSMIPWSLMIGLSYTLCAVFATRFMGNEFVSIISPLFAMLVATISARYNILIPKEVFKKSLVIKDVENKSKMNLFVAWSPYIIVIFLLLITRLVPEIKNAVKNNFLTDLFSLNNIFNTEISSVWEILYSPGFILIICAICASLIQSRKLNFFINASSTASKSLLNAFVSLCGTLAMVYLFRNSGIQTEVSMPEYIAQSLSIFENLWYMFAPFLGILGSFITGSGTVSTLTFSPIQAQMAENANLSTNIILAQQVMGGAIGNMICVHNVVAAAAVVNLEGSEGKIIKLTILPALILGVLCVVSALIYSL